jgi:hypothetical protein
MRLLASGCSYTDYYWSTWADVLGAEFDEYRQVGQGGCDNAFVARSIINTAHPGDTVVAMWTSYDRWSLYSDKVEPLPKNPNNHWRHIGSVALWDKGFFVKYYHRVERFQTTMDYVQLVDLHSRANGYTVYHFSAFPFFIAEIERNVDPRIVEIYNRYNIENNYLTSAPSLAEFREKNYNMLVNGDDPHPTPLCHWDYAEQIIAPKLNISLTQERKSSIMQEQQDCISGRLKYDEQ